MPAVGKRGRGRPRRRLKDCLREDEGDKTGGKRRLGHKSMEGRDLHW